MVFNIGDRVKVIVLYEADDNTGIQIGDIGTVVDVHNPGQYAISLDVQLDKKIIKDARNANCLEDNTYQFWEDQLESI